MPAATPLYKIIVVIHVLSAIVWVGGVLFVALVAVPTARTFDEQSKKRLLKRSGGGFGRSDGPPWVFWWRPGRI